MASRVAPSSMGRSRSGRTRRSPAHSSRAGVTISAPVTLPNTQVVQMRGRSLEEA